MLLRYQSEKWNSVDAIFPVSEKFFLSGNLMGCLFHEIFKLPYKFTNA